MSLPTILSISISSYKSELAITAAAFTAANIANLTKQPYIRLIGGIAALSVISFNKSKIQEHYKDFSSLPRLGKALTVLPAVAIGFITPAVFNSFIQMVSPLGHINFLISTLALNMLFVPLAKNQHGLIKGFAVALEKKTEKLKPEKPNVQIKELAALLLDAKEELDRKDARIRSLEETEQKYLELWQQIERRRAEKQALTESK